MTFSGATDNTAVTTHKVYTAPSGGSAVATGNSPLQVTGLTAGTAYTFYVSALDAAGNESARTASNSVTPTAAGSYPRRDGVLADNFTAADGAVIEGAPCPTAPTRRKRGPRHRCPLPVNSNRARAATGPTGQSAYAMVDTGFTKYKATITVPVLLTPLDAQDRLVPRSSTPRNTCAWTPTAARGSCARSSRGPPRRSSPGQRPPPPMSPPSPSPPTGPSRHGERHHRRHDVERCRPS